MPWQDTGPVVLPGGSASLYLVKQVRDEAHRFAITFHRELRGKGMTVEHPRRGGGHGALCARRRCSSTSSRSRTCSGASLDDILAAGVVPREVAEETYRVLRQYNDKSENVGNQAAREDGHEAARRA